MSEIGARFVCLVSGGIDSPAAAYLMLKRGVEVELLHMDNSPYSDEDQIQKVQEIREQLEIVTDKHIELTIAPHGRNQALLENNCRKGFQCVLCKRLMLMVAVEHAKKVGASAVITGESLGQVASQTIQNLRAESMGIEFPIIRPLIGLDKIEIEGIAKKAGTYDISIRTASVCKMVPTRPITMARMESVQEQESKVDLSEMVRFSVEHAEKIRDPHTPRS